MSARTKAYSTLAALLLAAHVAVALVVGAKGWDDGVITLAFSRTFAEAHRVALTPVSVSVEGFSSPFWFALMAVMYKVFAPGFYAFITLSQLWAALFTVVTALLTFRLVEHRLGLRGSWFCCLALFGAAPFLNETMNGMEMSALAALAVGIAAVLQSQTARLVPLLLLLGFLGPTVRLEAAGYLLGGAVALLLLSRAVAAAIALAGGVVGSVVLLTVVRLLAFGYWLPNTIRAKQWWPYSPQSLPQRLVSSEAALEHSAVLLAPVLVFAVALAVLQRRGSPRTPRDAMATVRGRALSPPSAFAVGYLAAVLAFNLAIGENWGYSGRMELSAVPLAFTLAVALVQPRAAITVPVAALVVAVAVASVPVFQVANVWDAVTRGPHGDSPGITPARYRTTARAADQVRQALGRPTIGYLTPDVGGSSLCCARLQVRDAALLANPVLARDGYAGFTGYLRRTAPDIIETHDFWTMVTGIEDRPLFVRNYVPVVVDRTLFYLRRPDFRVLADRCSYEPPDRATGLRYPAAAQDVAFLKSHFPRGLCNLRLEAAG